jgi:hypothetical protein
MFVPRRRITRTFIENSCKNQLNPFRYDVKKKDLNIMDLKSIHFIQKKNIYRMPIFAALPCRAAKGGVHPLMMHQLFC